MRSSHVGIPWWWAAMCSDRRGAGQVKGLREQDREKKFERDSRNMTRHPMKQKKNWIRVQLVGGTLRTFSTSYRTFLAALRLLRSCAVGLSELEVLD